MKQRSCLAAHASVLTLVAALVSGCAALSQDQATKTVPQSPVERVAPSPVERMVVLHNAGRLVNLAALSRPGFHTLFVFTTPWCGPCKLLEARMPAILARWGRLRVVFVEAASDKDDGESSIILNVITPLGLPNGFPVGVLYNSAGVAEDRLEGVDEYAIDQLMSLKP